MPCPELVSVHPTDRADLSIEIQHSEFPSGFGHDEHRAEIADVATYLVEGGDRIWVRTDPAARPEDVRQYLYGVALTAAFYQRGDSLIHAAAVAWEGGAHLFCGESGAGKSTLVTQLQRLGLTVLCDDVGIVRCDDAGVAHFFPGVARLKLWQDALTQFGIANDTLQRDLVRHDKFHLPLAAVTQPLPIEGVWELKSSGDRAPQITQVPKQQLFDILMNNTYRPRLLRRWGDRRAHVARCLAVARQGTGFEFWRPWDLRRVQESGTAFLTHMTGRQLRAEGH